MQPDPFQVTTQFAIEIFAGAGKTLCTEISNVITSSQSVIASNS